MSKSAWVAVVAAYVALIAAFWVADTIFERLPQLEDEFTYVYQAKLLARGDVTIESPQPQTAFWQPFLIDCNVSNQKYVGLDCDGERFGKYPPGWPLLLGLGYAVGLEWAVNPILLLLSVALVYRLGRGIFDARVGAVAAVLLAVSPIAWLQSGTLMSHSAALFFTLVCLYGLWRLEHGQRAWVWSILAGVGLGMVVAIRPLTGAGLGLPLVLYSGFRLGGGLLAWARGKISRAAFFGQLRPLLVMAVFTLMVGGLWPAFNYLTTGDATQNLYTLVWPYDRVGFGEGHGNYQGEELPVEQAVPAGGKIGKHSRMGHRIERAKETLRNGLECYSRDLFGWVMLPDAPPERVNNFNPCGTDNRGLSWVWLPLGVVFGWRQRWLGVLGVVAVSLIGVTMLYWIGHLVFSVRYYYESVGILAIVSAVGVVGLASWLQKIRLGWLVYGVLVVLLAWSGLVYNPQRLRRVEGYGRLGRYQIEAVDAVRENLQQPVLVVAYGEAHWREVGALMALTSPYLDSEYILARDTRMEWLPALVARFPEREVVYYVDGHFRKTLTD